MIEIATKWGKATVQRGDCLEIHVKSQTCIIAFDQQLQIGSHFIADDFDNHFILDFSIGQWNHPTVLKIDQSMRIVICVSKLANMQWWIIDEIKETEIHWIYSTSIAEWILKSEKTNPFIVFPLLFFEKGSIDVEFADTIQNFRIHHFNRNYEFSGMRATENIHGGYAYMQISDIVSRHGVDSLSFRLTTRSQQLINCGFGQPYHFQTTNITNGLSPMRTSYLTTSFTCKREPLFDFLIHHRLTVFGTIALCSLSVSLFIWYCCGIYAGQSNSMSDDECHNANGQSICVPLAIPPVYITE